uniref:Uncharacterized protein n=1 Tax=Romanomermis culicivorax TaxID=13658 RepID=A0A915L8E2_ROMCU
MIAIRERYDIIDSKADLMYLASNPLHLKYRNLCYGMLTDESNIYEPNITYQDDSNITDYVIRAVDKNFGQVVTFWSDDFWTNYTITSYDMKNQIYTGSRLLFTIDPFLVEQLKDDYYYIIEAHDSEETSAYESAKLGSTSIILINREWKVSMYEQLVPSFSVHILWQIPQYFLLTLAEILFCITGQEFSYSEAGENMRSIVLAFWYATVAIGNLLIMLLSLATVHFGRTGEFVFYAASMSLCLMIFIIFASHYKYLEIDRFGNVRKETDEDSRSSYEISCHL